MYRNRARYLRAAVCLLGIMSAAHFAYATGPAADDGPPLSSSFPGPLWQVVAPNGGTATVSDAHLLLNVPGGSNHDALLPSNQALRVVQPIGDDDFDISIKIDSPVVASSANTSQGLMVLSDDRNFLMFALVTDGTRIGLTGKIVTSGVAATVFNVADFNEYQNPMYLRLARARSTYIAYYSVDGSVWTQAATFTDTRIPTMLGPFAGNYNATPSRAVPVVMAINWFDIL